VKIAPRLNTTHRSLKVCLATIVAVVKRQRRSAVCIRSKAAAWANEQVTVPAATVGKIEAFGIAELTIVLVLEVMLNGTSNCLLLGCSVAVLACCVVLVTDIVDRAGDGTAAFLVRLVLDASADEVDSVVYMAKIAARRSRSSLGLANADVRAFGQSEVGGVVGEINRHLEVVTNPSIRSSDWSRRA
jgi:hypothetical protein